MMILGCTCNSFTNESSQVQSLGEYYCDGYQLLNHNKAGDSPDNVNTIRPSFCITFNPIFLDRSIIAFPAIIS